MTDFLSVLADFGVVEDRARIADLVYEGQAYVVLLVNRDSGVRRAAQIRKILGVGILDPLGVADAHARGNGRGRKKGGNGFQD